MRLCATEVPNQESVPAKKDEQGSSKTATNEPKVSCSPKMDAVHAVKNDKPRKKVVKRKSLPAFSSNDSAPLKKQRVSESQVIEVKKLGAEAYRKAHEILVQGESPAPCETFEASLAAC